MKRKQVIAILLASACAMSNVPTPVMASTEAEQTVTESKTVDSKVAEPTTDGVKEEPNADTTPTSTTAEPITTAVQPTATAQPSDSDLGISTMAALPDEKTVTVDGTCDEGSIFTIDSEEYTPGMMITPGEHVIESSATSLEYSLDGMTINGVEESTSVKRVTVEDGDTLTIHAKAIKNVLVKLQAENGTCSFANDQTSMYAKPNSTVTINLHPNAHYYAASVKVNRVSVPITGTTMEIQVGAEATDIDVEFKKCNQISVSKNSGGAVTVNGESKSSVDVIPGSNVSVAITPEDGYDFEKVNEIPNSTMSTTGNVTTITFTADNSTNLNVSFKKSETVKVTSKKQVIDTADANGVTYKYIALSSKTYDVVAAEDIYKNNVILFHAGDVIQKLTTGADGVATTTVNFNGNVKLREENNPDSERVITFNASGAGESTYNYDAQKMNVVINRKDTNSSTVGIDLIAKKDITIDGGLTIAAGTVIGHTTMTTAKATFENLPSTKYATSEDAYDFKITCEDGTYYDEAESSVVKDTQGFTLNLATKPQNAIVTITDESGSSIAGAIMKAQMIENAAGEKIENGKSYVFETTSTGYTLTKLPAGVYQLTTVNTAPGYVPIGEKTVTFEIISGQNITPVSLQEKKNTLTVNVLDQVDGAKVIGSTFGIYKMVDGDEILCKQFGDEGVLTEEATVSGLEEGEYVIKAISTPDGYQRAALQMIIVDQSQEMYGFSLLSSRTYGYVSVELLSSINRDPLENGEYELSDGKNVVASFITNKEGKAQSIDVEIGKYENGKYMGPITYKLYQTKAPEGYQLDKEQYDIQFEYLGEDVPVVSISATLPNEKVVEEKQRMKTVTKVIGDTKAPKTGDKANALPFAVAAGLSLAGIATITIKKKKLEED